MAPKPGDGAHVVPASGPDTERFRAKNMPGMETTLRSQIQARDTFRTHRPSWRGAATFAWEVSFGSAGAFFVA